MLFEGIKSLPDSIGHIDLYDGKNTAQPTGEYWHEAKECSLWELKD